jgi:uncharacterized SAM-binding protein YcdF (DUF218 family)
MAKRIVLIVALILTVYVSILAIDIYTFSFVTDHEPADAAIVLGAAVSNGQPSPVFRERIKHAIDLYESGQVKSIIFTGGIGKDDQIAESLVAARYAITSGVAAQDTFCETTSKITRENLQGAKDIVKQLGISRVLIVSDPLHMRRAVVMARDLGMDAYPSPTPTTKYTSFRSRFEFLVREVYFYGSYLIGRSFEFPLSGESLMTSQPCQ